MQGDRVLQALEVQGFDGFTVFDMAGDGGRLYILARLENPATKGPLRFPKAVSGPLSASIEYSDGSLHAHSRSRAGIDTGVYQLNAAGELEKAFDLHTRVSANSSLGTHHFVWADLYGDGRPVACEILIWGDVPFAGKHTTSQDLTRYWHRDAATGAWVNETVCLPVETKAKSPDFDALKGSMAPATFKPTPLMLLRDRIRRVLPAGWSASIESYAEIRITSNEPRVYARKKDLETKSREEIMTTHGYLQKNRIILSVAMRPALSPQQVAEARVKAAAARAERERVRARIDPAVLGGAPPRTPEQQALLNRLNHLDVTGCSWLEPDIITPEWFFNVWNSSMSKEATFFNEADAAEFARLEKAVKEVLTGYGNVPKAKSHLDEPAHPPSQSQP
jgi:hypothetical protein